MFFIWLEEEFFYEEDSRIRIDSATGVELQYAPTSNWKVKATAARISADDLEDLTGQDDEAATYFAGEINYTNGKWEAGVGYHRVGLGTHSLPRINEDTFQVADAGVAYAFDKNVKASFDYARATDWKVNDDSHKDSYNVQVSYKGADAADKGSWGASVAYRSLSPYAAFTATYDHVSGFDGVASLKGWEIGADYAFAKNIVATAKYFNSKDVLLNDKDKVTGVWSRVDFLF